MPRCFHNPIHQVVNKEPYFALRHKRTFIRISSKPSGEELISSLWISVPFCDSSQKFLTTMEYALLTTFHNISDETDM